MRDGITERDELRYQGPEGVCRWMLDSENVQGVSDQVKWMVAVERARDALAVADNPSPGGES